MPIEHHADEEQPPTTMVPATLRPSSAPYFPSPIISHSGLKPAAYAMPHDGYDGTDEKTATTIHRIVVTSVFMEWSQK